MIDKICEYLTNRIRKQMPEIDEERAETIMYGLQLIIGEIPKIILLFAVAIILKIGGLVIFAYTAMLPYKTVAGGFHLKTNIGCTIGTFVVYFGNVLISKYIVMEPIYIKYLIIGAIWIFSIIMITLYAPADTINLPILRKKERKTKKILSYIFATITLIASIFIKNSTISNILLFNVLIESISISRLAYKLTKNEYGYETYSKQEVLG
ncbi:MAG: accessory gene regulator B family protein [Clostridia bacterium]